MAQKKSFRFSIRGKIVGLLIGRKTLDSISSLIDRSYKITDISKRLYEINTDLSSSTTQQAAALQETSSAADEISAMTDKNAKNAKSSQDTSAASLKMAQRGKEVIATMMQSIEAINRSNSDIMKQIAISNQQIAEIVKVINEIGNKTKVINDIVFQTKLLSFNAAVEAARAGEHGKGFSVVAEEVGNLAQMSGNAAKEISQMLTDSTKKVEQIVSDTQSKVGHLMDVSKGTVTRGTETAKQCGEVLDEIVQSVSQAHSLVGEIAVASHEQSQGIGEINKAVNQLSLVMQNNSVVTQNASNTSKELREQSDQLSQIVHMLSEVIHKDFEFSQKESSKEFSEKVVPISNAKSNSTNINKKVKDGQNDSEMVLKLASGSELIPSRDDKRFEEV